MVEFNGRVQKIKYVYPEKWLEELPSSLALQIQVYYYVLGNYGKETVTDFFC